jgi:hypothetical protein
MDLKRVDCENKNDRVIMIYEKKKRKENRTEKKEESNT